MSHQNDGCDVCKKREAVERQRNNLFVWYIGMASFVGAVTNSVHGALVGAVIGLIVGWLVEKKIV